MDNLNPDLQKLDDMIFEVKHGLAFPNISPELRHQMQLFLISLKARRKALQSQICVANALAEFHGRVKKQRTIYDPSEK